MPGTVERRIGLFGSLARSRACLEPGASLPNTGLFGRNHGRVAATRRKSLSLIHIRAEPNTCGLRARWAARRRRAKRQQVRVWTSERVSWGVAGCPRTEGETPHGAQRSRSGGNRPLGGFPPETGEEGVEKGAQESKNRNLLKVSRRGAAPPELDPIC